MIVNVHIADGRTVFQFASRGDLRRAIVGDDTRAVDAFVKREHEMALGWVPVRVTHLRRNSVSFVLSAQDCADGLLEELPAKALLDKRAAKWADKQQAEAQEVPA